MQLIRICTETVYLHKHIHMLWRKRNNDQENYNTENENKRKMVSFLTVVFRDAFNDPE